MTAHFPKPQSTAKRTLMLSGLSFDVEVEEGQPLLPSQNYGADSSPGTVSFRVDLKPDFRPRRGPTGTEEGYR